MKFEYLQAFITVAEAGSFSRAGGILYLSQPTLSRYVTALEESIGVSLLVRDKRTNSVILTNSGQQLYNDCKDFLKKLSVAEQRARDICKGTVGSLVIQNIPPCWRELYEITKLFISRYPGVEVTILNNGQPPESVLDNCDIRVMHSFELMHYTKLLECFRVKRDPYVVLVSPDSPLAEGERITLQELRRCKIVDSGGMCRSMMLEWRLGSPINVFTSMETSILELYKSDAVMIATRSSSESFATVTKRLELMLPTRSEDAIYLCWDKNIVNPTVPLFINVAREWRSEHPDILVGDDASESNPMRYVN